MLSIAKVQSEFQPESINTGLTFVEISQAAIAHTSWQLAYFYDLKNYFELIKNLEETINQIKALCAISMKKKECEILLELLENHIDNSKYNAERVESFNNARRKKRAILGYIGDFNSWLFGYMTQEDAEVLAKNIRRLQARVVKQQELFENQLMIVEQTVNINNKTYNDMKKAIAELNENLNEFERNVTINDKISTLTEIATLIIVSHSQISQTLMDILQNSLNGQIINLISQKQIRKDLQIITENLKNHQRLPINLKNQHPYNIFAVTTSKATLYDKKILIKLRIPIIDRDELFLYKTIPIPSKIEEKLIIIVPTTKYFLYSRNKVELTPITYEELNKCQKTTRNELLCTPESPTIVSREASCELSLLTDLKKETIQDVCEFRFVPKKNYFIQIHENNEFYCVINTPIMITETCPESTNEMISITQNGKIKIKPGCTIRTNEIKITAYKTIEAPTQLLNPIFQLNKVNRKNIIEIAGNLSYLMDRNFSVVVLENRDDEIIQLSNKIKEDMKKVKEKIKIEDMIYNKGQDTYTTILLTSVGIILIIIFYKKCLK